MTRWKSWPRTLSSLAVAALLVASTDAQAPRIPTARLIAAPWIELPAEIDSSNPAVWARVGAIDQLFVMSSWGGIPVISSGTKLDTLRAGDPVAFASHPGHGVWMEAIVPDSSGVWYGYYHHERPADGCGRHDRQLPRIGAMRSSNNGQTWDDLGIILDAPPGSDACDSNNRFVLGGIGDVTAALDAAGNDVYLYYSQYTRDGASQGVVVARIAWADRDRPMGKATIWNNGAWLPARQSSGSDIGWEYPPGSPLVPSRMPFHDRDDAGDVFWGPSIHWNTYLNQYVMLLNRAKNDYFEQDGIYVSFSPTLADPSRWSAPVKILTGVGWYPQVIGEQEGAGTDRIAGRRARFFVLGKSQWFIHFDR
jgi:hypothetical protein